MGDLEHCVEDCQKAIDWNKEYNLHTDYKIIARAYARMGKKMSSLSLGMNT